MDLYTLGSEISGTANLVHKLKFKSKKSKTDVLLQGNIVTVKARTESE